MPVRRGGAGGPARTRTEEPFDELEGEPAGHHHGVGADGEVGVLRILVTLGPGGVGLPHLVLGVFQVVAPPVPARS